MMHELQCPVCKNMLGELELGQTHHRFCRWATAADWVALRPYLKGDIRDVFAAGC